MKRRVSFFLGAASLFLLLAFGAIAAEATTIGAACSGSVSAADWDTIAQCVSSVWKRAPLWLGASSDTCDSSHAGILQWTGAAFQACDGTSWTTLSLN